VRSLKIFGTQCLLAVLLLEIALRLYNPLPFRLRGNHIVLPVLQSYTFNNQGTRKLDPVTHHTKNSLGFRGPEPPRDFAKRLTIMTIGGSTTEGLFISDGKTWTDVMARALAPSFPGLWVNNAGLDGQSTYGHLVLVRDVVAALRPSVAVFLIGTNDVGLGASNSFDTALTPAAPGFLRRAATFVIDHSEVAAVAQNLVRAQRARQRGFGHSEIDVASINDLHIDPEVMAATLQQYSAGLAPFAERLSALTALCRRNGIEPVFVTQPALFGEVVDRATGVDLSRKQVNGRGNGALEWKLLESYNTVTRRVAAQHGVFLIDLAARMPKDSRLFYDFLHFTNEGSEVVGTIVATAIAPYLREQVLRQAVNRP
jgi:lysophospholipase L1-like esterase